LQFIGEKARKTRLGNFLKKVPQAPQKLPEKIGKNSHIAFFKWVNRLHLSFFQESFEVPRNFLKSFLVGCRGKAPHSLPDKAKFETKESVCENIANRFLCLFFFSEKAVKPYHSNYCRNEDPQMN